MTIDLVAFGKLVREKRKALCWSGEALAAEALGNPNLKNKVSEVENGRGNRAPDTIRKYCRTLGITADELPGLSEILHDPASGQAAIDQLIAEKGSLEAALHDARDLHRGALIALADRFGIDRPSSRPDHQLRAELDALAEEYTALKSRIDGMDDRIPALHNLKQAAKGAIDLGHFDEVEEILARVDEVETELNAETKETRARNELMRNCPEQAFAHFSAAADMFQGIDAEQVVTRRLHYGEQLFQHGQRRGGAGLALAEQMIRDALDRIDGAKNTELWATAQNNLGNALANQGRRQAGATGLVTLKKAVKAYGAALLGYTEAEHPVNRAAIMQNLASALQIQSGRQVGAAGLATLKKAVKAYGAALLVYTEAEHPLNWAKTMQNLAVALQTLGSRQAEAAGLALLQDAADAHDAALRVRTKDEHPADWAMTQENLAILQKSWADHPDCTDPLPHLQAGLAHVEAALTVYDPVHMPYDHGTATELRDDLLATIAALGGGGIRYG